MPDAGPRAQDLAEDFCQNKKHLEEVIYIEDIDSFAIYQGDKGYFQIQKPREFERYVYFYIKPKIKKSLTANYVRDVATQIRWMIYRKVKSSRSQYVSLADKLLNTTTLDTEDFALSKPTFFHLDIPSNVLSKTPGCPKFEKFLEEVLVEKFVHKPDVGLRNLVQEMFGYCMLDTVEAHATFFLVGDGANGKSVLLNILRALIGDEFTTAMSIETLTTDKFATAELVGKKVNICAEEESTFTKGDRFKALISGDVITAQRKFGDHFAFYPNTISLFATNEMPTFKNLNDGLLRRIKIIPFFKKIPAEQRNTRLLKELLKELPGIFAWAIEGAKRLILNGYRFSNPPATARMSLRLQEALSSAVTFARERYVEQKGAFISNEDLYESYHAWCGRRGRKQLSFQNFIDDLRKSFRLSAVQRWNPETKLNERGRQLVVRVDAPVRTTEGSSIADDEETDTDISTTSAP